MRYLFAFVFPPLAVLLCGKPFQFLLSIPLTICLWIPGVIYALLVVSSHKADKRNDKLIRAIQQQPR